MPNPIREEIINAHDALSSLTYLADNYISSTSGGGDEVRELRQAIIKALPPRPQPTMAEIEWDNDKHRFAEAENPDHGEVIMLNVSQISGKVRIFFNQYGEFYLGYASPENLTPTGRKYELKEIEHA